MVIFHSYVSLPEGNWFQTMITLYNAHGGWIPPGGRRHHGRWVRSLEGLGIMAVGLGVKCTSWMQQD